MNAKRRAKVKAAVEQIEMLIASVEDIRDEEEDAYDRMPDQLQSSQKGDAMQDGIQALENCMAELDSASGWLADVLNG